ncbi:peptidoglycan DD-metalloendopeptidase family protein [Tropicibacter oceani]|uniref:Peptidoglycan DD-metalloendopeptidase family protein n=1 Tax=Tropicibacter oceani TaxID=3058420 RepID=A0ABY8QEN0_9RHOB|nr:peptidoglycan DD-metalloendopeptidase family protein [Tropicibacter oceani]WGW03089.1 peptidoglycan DD-metalloendopeptidase family protein [Tropicibacter oceani]
MSIARFPRITSALALSTALAACSGPIDLDLRGKMGSGFDTAQAAQNASPANRPSPDDRGILSYPNYQVAVARRGDTVADVAARVGLPADELARYNGVRTTDPLRRGEIIALPRRVAEPSPATGADTTGPIRPAAQVDVTTLAGNAIERAASTTPAASGGATGVEPVRHQVARGETAFTIARLYNVSPRSLGEWNGLDEQFSVREGQFLLIPVNRDAAPVVETAAVTQPGAGSPTPQPPSASKPLPTEVPAAATKPEPAKEPVADIGQSTSKPASNAAMTMPVAGSIIRDYAKGRNEGIDIAASAGTPVKAAASGQVASISTTAEGVKFLLVRHPDDVITVYTHLDDITVQKGDAVSRGQVVGKVRAGDPAFLHFEVRKGFESTDPMAYLQ